MNSLLYAKDSLKKFLLLFLINILTLLPLLCFLSPHFSIDTYGMNFGYEGHIDAFIGSYRYFGAFLIKVWTSFFNPVNNPALDLIIYIFITAFIIAFFVKFLFQKLNCFGFISILIINSSVCISISNIWINDILTFPECIFILGIGNVCCFCGLIIFFTTNLKLHYRYILSGILLIFSTAIYQQYLIIFIIYAILMTSIDSALTTSNRLLILKHIKLACFILLCAVLYYVIGVAVQGIFNIVSNPRVALNLKSIFNNLVYFAGNQHSYLKGRGFFSTEILTICYLSVALVWIISFIYYIKKYKFNAKAALILFSYIAAYISSFGMGLISTSRSHRTMFGLFSVFALFSIGSILLMNNKFTKYILCMVLILVYGLNIYKTVEMSINQYVTNTVERVYTNLYISEITAYEHRTGITVNKIEICTDLQCDIIDNENALTVRYAFEPLIEFTSGKKYDVKTMSDETKNRLFDNSDWKEYVPSEQLLFDNDTLYLCVY